MADILLKTATAIRIMGGKCIVGGIQPGIARTIIKENIDLSGIIPKADLASALKASFDSMGMHLVKR